MFNVIINMSMKHAFLKCKRCWLAWVAAAVMSLVGVETVRADVPLRRPISPESPMWIVHIDTWNYPDPERIIEMIPEDVLPYVVFNISLSADDSRCANGYDVCDSWLKACAQKRVWSMVQCASGGHSRFSDHDLSVYEDYFRKYPNFIGWNFAEQFWGFDEDGTPSFLERLALFGDILKICHRYGGYLVVCFTQALYSANMMPIAYMKRNPEVNRLLTEHPEHFICCEKYTMQDGFYDIESNCLGAWLGGYAGHYGIRFDECGWSATDSDGEPFVRGLSSIPIMEHVMLTGETVIDGPELIWRHVSRELSTTITPDGYTRRNWGLFPHFVNTNLDGFRKILDGTVRIPTRDEVIDRTKICIQNDLSTGGFEDYLTPATLFDGLYRPECDRDNPSSETYNNSWLENKWWLKSSGRYPTIPQVYDLLDESAQRLQVVKVSEYDNRWPSVADKVAELNQLFPEEYTGDMYASHMENTWMLYNPYQYDDKVVNGVRERHYATEHASGNVPFLYNTADSIFFDFSPYAMAVMKEFGDSVLIYMSNYRNAEVNGNYVEDENATDVIRIYGATAEPVVKWTDRGDHRASEVKQTWEDGVLTLTVSHNGPLEIGIKCSGTATDRLTDWTSASMKAPETAPVYTGTLQYEAECFDYKNIGACRTNGYYNGHPRYQGQGYIEMGTDRSAAIRDTVNVLRSGTYTLSVRYQAPDGGVSMGLYINGSRKIMSFRPTQGEWMETSTTVDLNAGMNTVQLRFTSIATNILIDCIKIDRADANVYTFEEDEATTAATDPAAQMVSVIDGTAGVVTLSGDEGDGQAFHAYTSGDGCMGQAVLDLYQHNATDYSVSWKQVSGEAGVLLRGGYLFRLSGGKVSVSTVEKTAEGHLQLVKTLSEAELAAGLPYLRATVRESELYLDASVDGETWQNVLSATDETFRMGDTRLCWEGAMTVDDITLYSSGLTVSQTDIEEITMTDGGSDVVTRSFDVSGTDLLGDVTVSLDDCAYEISTDSLGDYTDQIVLGRDRLTDDASPIRIFVRLKSDTGIGDYTGTVTLSTQYLEDRTIALEGRVSPTPYTTFYDFEEDNVTSGASTPPADGVTVGTSNRCTAGVTNYTDKDGHASKMLRAYSATGANGTGVLNLEKFTQESTDYSVTWRQVLTSSNINYKNGVLLRGDPSVIGNSTHTEGYTAGIMAGYYMNVFNTGSDTQFRIYKSTSATSLDMINSRTVDLVVATGQSMWYRASVSGTSKITLKIEYSTDGETWQEGTSTADEGGTFQKGATQFVWGLASSTNNFLVDDITFEGITYDESVTEVISAPMDETADVVREEYFDLSGRRIIPGDATKGVVIRRSYLSNGAVKVDKLLKN